MWFNTFCMPSHCALGSWEPSFCAASVEGTGVVLGLLSRFLAETMVAMQRYVVHAQCDRTLVLVVVHFTVDRRRSRRARREREPFLPCAGRRQAPRDGSSRSEEPGWWVQLLDAIIAFHFHYT